jgi:NAD-specific glutamate dehydrogenase
VVKTMVDSRVDKLSKVDLAKWKGKGFSREVAQQLVLLPEMDVALEAFFFSRQQGLSVTDALAWVDNLDAQFGYEWLGNAIESLPFMTLWDLSQIGILFQTMFQQKIQLIKYAQSLQAQNKSFHIKTLKESLKTLNANGTELYFSTLEQLQLGHDLNLTNLTVTINRLNFIIGVV